MSPFQRASAPNGLTAAHTCASVQGPVVVSVPAAPVTAASAGLLNLAAFAPKVTRMKRLAYLTLALAACSGSSGESCDTWTQWGQGAAHAGAVCASGQPLGRVLAHIVYDPFNADEIADPASRGGDLLVHYQAPLVVGDDVYMVSGGGPSPPCTVVPPPQNVVVCDDYRKNSMTWLEKGFRWQGGSLVEKWTFTSDWKPVPSQSFEPMFQPAVSGDAIY